MSIEPPAREFAVATDVGEEVARRSSLKHYPALLALTIALGALFLVSIGMPDIAGRRYGDPDDLMRLQEVRDWMAGQSWFDVTQYRVTPPGGMSMHWSRLVDVPIATVISIVRPFAGQAFAELAAAVVVPLVTFASIAILAAALARRLTGSDRFALLCAALMPIDCGIISTSRPMRIDHHGWQAACALGMVLALTGRRGWRPAAMAGAVAALWMHISLEGAILAAACGGWLGLLWILEPGREQHRLPAYLAAITASSLALFLIAHGGALLNRNFADAISPIHLVVFALATLGAFACRPLAGRAMIWRGVGLGLVAAAAAAVYKLFGPQHADNPFAALGPLSYRLWYLHIPEGLPLWTQPLQMSAMLIAYPLVTIAAVASKLRKAEGDERRMLLDYGALLLIATLIGVVLQRGCYTANLIALPGGILLTKALLRPAAALRPGPIRALALAGAILFTSPLSPAIAAMLLIPSADRPASPADRLLADRGDACIALTNLSHLDALPPSLFMMPNVTAEDVVVASHHSSVAAGYHRDHDALEASLRFFTGDEAAARAVVRRYHPAYVMLCPGQAATTFYARTAPDGLAARLSAGRPPAWLKPVTVPGLAFAKVYRIVG